MIKDIYAVYYINKDFSMSDYQYDADYPDYEYEEPDMEENQEEDIEAVIEIDYFNAEELVRQNNIADALTAFQSIYQQACDNNLRNWKIKTMVQILEIHALSKKSKEVQKTLAIIKQINQSDKLTETTVKSIIMMLQKCPRNQYQSYWADLFSLISTLDENGKIKSFSIMLQKEINENNKAKSGEIFKKMQSAIENAEKLPLGSELEALALEIKYLQLIGQSPEKKLRNLHIKIPLFEEETHINDAYLSFIKEEIAGILYAQGNYLQCTNYLCSSFCENAKFGKTTPHLKELLKVNVLALLLCQNKQLLTNKEYNPMLHQSTSTFKMDQDIQALFGLIEAFKNLNIENFQQIFKVVELKMDKKSQFADIHKRTVIELKKHKVEYIAKVYKVLTFDYISRRINQKDDQIIEILFSLINEQKISGVIHLEQRYLEKLPTPNPYFYTQIKNLKELAIRL